MKRKIRISRLKREIRRLRRENKKLYDKHWSECMQISQYDNANKLLKRLLTMVIDLAESLDAALKKMETDSHCEAELKPPKKTYTQDYLERYPGISINTITGAPHICRAIAYDDNTLSCGLKTCAECWNEVMKDE